MAQDRVGNPDGPDHMPGHENAERAMVTLRNLTHECLIGVPVLHPPHGFLPTARKSRRFVGSRVRLCRSTREAVRQAPQSAQPRRDRDRKPRKPPPLAARRTWRKCCGQKEGMAMSEMGWLPSRVAC